MVVGKRLQAEKKNCIKFVFIRKDITTKIFAFDNDIDLIITFEII